MSNVFTPTTDVDDLYGDGDWRPILGGGPRKLDYKVYMIGKQSIEHKLRGVLLPSFDWTMSLDDQSFFANVGPCWTSQPDKRLPRHFTPNAFALPILMYPYMGENKEHWISPQNRAKMIGCDTTDPEEFADAFDDLNKWIRKKFRNDEVQKDFFLKAKSMKEDPLVPGRTARYFSLAWCKDKDNDWHLAVVGYTSSAYSYLIEQMRWPQPHGEEARDSDWPQYLLGDPTNPANAMIWNVDKIQLDAKDTHESNVLCFTERREFLEGTEFREIPQKVLESRFRLPDPENWNFPTYEEQVRYMMENYHPAVTAEMIQAACGARCREEIPSARPEHIAMQASKSPDEEEPRQERRTRRHEEEDAGDPMAAVTGGGGGGGFAPQSAAPPQPDLPDEQPSPAETAKSVAAASSAVDAGKSYFAGRPGEKKPSKLTVGELQEIADKREHEGVKVMVEKNVWKSLEESGLVTIPDPEPEVPADEVPSVPDDEVPSVPSDDEVPSVPDEPAAVPADAPTESGVSKEAFRSKLFPTWDDLTPEQQAKAGDLLDRAYAATDNGQNSKLPDDIVKEMMEVMA